MGKKLGDDESPRKRIEVPIARVVLLGLGIFFLVAKPTSQFPWVQSSWYERGVVFVLIPFAMEIAIIAHELGHAFASLAFGLGVRRFEFWPVSLDFGPPHWRAGWLLGRTGGQVARRRPFSSAWAAFVVLSAGIVSNLIVALMAWQFRRPNEGVIYYAPLNAAWDYLPGVIGGTSLFLGLLNLLPVKRNWPRVVTDGARMLDLLLREGDFAVPIRLHACLALSKPVREWPLSLEEAVGLVRDVRRDGGHSLLYVAGMALDLDRLDVARELLARPRFAAEPHPAGELMLMEACIVALADGDAAGARSFYDAGAAAPLADPGYSLLAEAAVLVSEGRLEEARPKMEQWKADTARADLPVLRETSNLWTLKELEKRFMQPVRRDMAVAPTGT